MLEKNNVNKIAKKNIYFVLIFIATVFLFSGCDSDIGNVQPATNIQKTTQVQGVATENKKDIQPVANINEKNQVQQEKIVNNNDNVKLEKQKSLKLKEKKTYKTKERAVSAVKPKTCGDDYYVNVSGNCVHRPSSNPSGASAKCRDGSYSYSQHRRGTCSGHGGVAQWL